MNPSTLWRASLSIDDHVGRTLSGMAIPWERPARVRDQTGPAYLEAFASGSTDVTRMQHDNFPVFAKHDYTADPLGVVTFERSAEGLVFEATLSRTRDADEKLELVNDGAMRSVSVGFVPIKDVQRSTAGGPVTWRTEIRLRELSLAPTGFGQVPEARVLAVRSEVEGTPVLDALRRRANRVDLPTC